MFGKRILILAAHPDDEVVACAATIGRAQAAGAEIFVLYFTHGCIPRESMWSWQRGKYDIATKMRRTEAEEAAQLLGIKPLGWSGSRPARKLWRELPKAYAGTKSIVEKNGIDQIWVPAYEGGNPDHDALNAIGQKFKDQLSVIEFAEYNFAGGHAQSHSFPQPNGNEKIIHLTLAECNHKQNALDVYKSEKKNLDYVKTYCESYRPLADHDYSQPPHPGKLWYTRFQWVPFPHPGVDRTKPDDVSKAIMEFLKGPAAAKPESNSEVDVHIPVG